MYNATYLLVLLGPPAAFWWFAGWLVALVTLLGGFVLAVTTNRAYVVLQERRGNTIYSVANLTLATLPASHLIVGFAAVRFLS